MSHSKRFLFLFLQLFIIVGSLYADDCADALTEAKQKYQNGDYIVAKQLFEYVQGECGTQYGSVDQWLLNCKNALSASEKASTTKHSSSSATSTILSANQTQINVPKEGSSVFVDITSNTSWYVSKSPDSWCQLSSSSSGITLRTSSNSGPDSRSTYIQIMTTNGNKSLKVNISQEAGGTVTSQTSPSNTATLSLSKTSVSAYSHETTEYIAVECNASWEIEYPSGDMYSVTRSGKMLTITIKKNTTGNSRSDYFNVKTTDGSKVIRVNLSQTGATNTSNNSRKYHSSFYNFFSDIQYALSDFNACNGNFEMFWWGMSTGLGTAYGLEATTCALRWSWFGFEPVVLGCKYDFIHNDFVEYYQPDVKFYIPWNNEFAVTMAIGPSVEFSGYYGTDCWFKTELGVHWHYGVATSSNFFLRYDGAFIAGVSIQFGTGW